MTRISTFYPLVVLYANIHPISPHTYHAHNPLQRIMNGGMLETREQLDGFKFRSQFHCEICWTHNFVFVLKNLPHSSVAKKMPRALWCFISTKFPTTFSFFSYFYNRNWHLNEKCVRWNSNKKRWRRWHHFHLFSPWIRLTAKDRHDSKILSTHHYVFMLLERMREIQNELFGSRSNATSTRL